ncbi:LuxR C-terminal-related transcriptional regulator [Kitasatospora sp. LaBMicrA B282]|uniref:LuxR C-terminal-related transcriptional regulator n=1 Tax=Kitasatospora sp. LaBMicrA B282 TaxID=3420949 RepID=UPI003D0D27AA
MNESGQTGRDWPGEQAQQEADLRVYAWFAARRPADPYDAVAAARDTALDPSALAASVERLRQAGLLAPSPAPAATALPDGLLHPNAPLHAVSPQAALSRRTAPLEAEIRERRQRVDHLHQAFDRFAPLYQPPTPTSSDFEVITSLPEVRALLNHLADRCTSDMVTCQPGGGARVPEAMAEALGRDRDLLERGVRIRTLYHHTARFNGPSQAYVAAASQLGAEYRTAHELPQRLIIMDRTTALIPTEGDADGAVVIREPSTVAYLHTVFELAWSNASPYQDATGRAMEAVARELHRTILRLLADGLKDEAIARRLGMSLRTARRHIADILEQLGVDSRFQAGVAATRAGLLDTATG